VLVYYQPPFGGWDMSRSQEAVAVLFGWEGNCRSGVTLAVCHKLYDIYTNGEGLREEDVHSYKEYGTFTFTLLVDDKLKGL